MVLASIGCYRQKPRLYTAFSTKRAHFGKCTKEHVLRNIFRLMIVTDIRVGKIQHILAVKVHPLVKYTNRVDLRGVRSLKQAMPHPPCQLIRRQPLPQCYKVTIEVSSD